MLVDSEVGKGQILENFNCRPERIRVLPYTVPFYIRRKLFAQSDQLPSIKAPYFFYPAQYWSHKNHGRLLQAFQKLLKVDPKVQLVLAGSAGNHYDHVQRAIQQLGLEENVLQLGYVENGEMVALYRKALALVFPTFFGPTNIPPLEAMALGCPILVSDIYGMREQLGEAAHYFNPRSVDSIYDSMRLALEGKVHKPVLPEHLNFETFRHRLESILFEI